MSNRNSTAKMRKKFFEDIAKISPENFYRYRDIGKPKRFHSIMTSLTMFTSSQNRLTSYGFCQP